MEQICSKSSACYTYDAYGRVEDACAGCSYETDWFPTIEDIEKFILPDPVRFIPFMIWLLGNGPEVRMKQALTEAQKEARKRIYQILYDSVKLVDA